MQNITKWFTPFKCPIIIGLSDSGIYTITSTYAYTYKIHELLYANLYSYAWCVYIVNPHLYGNNFIITAKYNFNYI